MWTPDITVAAVCPYDGKFLLVEERSKSTNEIVFNQPAGHLEKGESILDAVIRETLEETCCHFTPEALVGLYRLEAANGKTYIRVTFCGSISEQDPVYSLDPDIIRTHWFSPDEVRQNQALRSPLVLSCIDDYLSGQRYPLELLREL
ncbi:NUDIX hydrolase [Arenicella xantha]|uniref:Phosphatase NudJ n=1 Tax=Arenicella xantha TaxID=644221 RepID=A0A395JLT4_9GAMM|nr:NUDIX hydrolase [Arenicella xantha]RBP51559.1 ADP-ribose pyrophosphatase YjhB (NUDIX family) [Arenicella xantha]